MINIIQYRNLLYWRYSKVFVILLMLAGIVLSLFAIYSGVYVECSFIAICYASPLKSINYSLFSVEIQNIFPIQYDAKHYLNRNIFIELTSLDSLPVIIPSVTACFFCPQCILLLMCLVVIMSILHSYFILLCRRKKSMNAINIISGLPGAMFFVNYQSFKDNFISFENWIHTHGLQIGIYALCFTIICYFTTSLLIERLLDRHPFCSPEVVAKNTNRKK